MKQCTICKEYKDTTEFYKRKASKDGLSYRCKVCFAQWETEHREKFPEKYNIKVKRASILYSCQRVGITPKFLEEYGDNIEWYCEICGKDIIDTLHMDHNHSTGKFRGLLCKKCNLGLGNFNDSPELLQKAIEYLKNKN